MNTIELFDVFSKNGRKYMNTYDKYRSRHQGSNVAGIYMWGIKLAADNKVTDTMNQCIHIRLFQVFIIRLVTYYIVIYLPN